jgi:hypothetical protein
MMGLLCRFIEFDSPSSRYHDAEYGYHFLRKVWCSA